MRSAPCGSSPTPESRTATTIVPGLVLVAADQDLSGPVPDRLHGLDAVHDEIQENLLELDPVAEHRRYSDASSAPSVTS